jgi:hypothetical protein
MPVRVPKIRGMWGLRHKSLPVIVAMSVHNVYEGDGVSVPLADSVTPERTYGAGCQSGELSSPGALVNRRGSSVPSALMT